MSNSMAISSLNFFGVDEENAEIDDESSYTSSSPYSSGSEEFEEESIWPQLDIPGTWGTYGLEEEPWKDSSKPFTKFKTYEELSLTEEEENGVLTDRIMATASSYLDRCPETGRYVICKCTLIDRNLRDISLIKYHHYLQFLNLSRNQLDNLEALGQLPFLMYLDVSFNFLETVLEFKPPFNLTYVNYSYNNVNVIRDLSEFWSLVNLNLSHNRIDIIQGLEQLRFLRYLDLSHNNIEIIENLSDMRLLKLNLEHNKIKHALMKFSTLGEIISVNLNYNCMKSLIVFKDALSIQSISMVCNKIDSFMEIAYFYELFRLTVLDLRENPIIYLAGYTESILVVVSKLLVLDGNYIESDEKAAAAHKYMPEVSLVAGMSHARLLALEQFAHPFLKTPIIWGEKSPIPIVVLVGPPGSGKRALIKKIQQEFGENVQVGVSHTTRMRVDEEMMGEDYYYVDFDEFKRLVKVGDMVTVIQFLGNFFGLCIKFSLYDTRGTEKVFGLLHLPYFLPHPRQQEIYRTFTNKKILILHMDILGALTLKIKGLQPKLILAMPSTAQAHRMNLEAKYTYTQHTHNQHCRPVETVLYRMTGSCIQSPIISQTEARQKVSATRIINWPSFAVNNANVNQDDIKKRRAYNVASEILEEMMSNIEEPELKNELSGSSGLKSPTKSLEDYEAGFVTTPSLSCFISDTDDDVSKSDKSVKSDEDSDCITIVLLNEGRIKCKKKNTQSLSGQISGGPSVIKQQPSILKKADNVSKPSMVSKEAAPTHGAVSDVNVMRKPSNKLSVTFSISKVNIGPSGMSESLSQSLVSEEGAGHQSKPSVTTSNSDQETVTTEEDYKKEVQTLIEDNSEGPDDNIEMFFNQIIKSRVMYLRKHNDNPGLFCETVFTNDVDAAMVKLEKLFKECTFIQSVYDARPAKKNESDEKRPHHFIVEKRLEEFEKALKEAY